MMVMYEKLTARYMEWIASWWWVILAADLCCIFEAADSMIGHTFFTWLLINLHMHFKPFMQSIFQMFQIQLFLFRYVALGNVNCETVLAGFVVIKVFRHWDRTSMKTCITRVVPIVTVTEVKHSEALRGLWKLKDIGRQRCACECSGAKRTSKLCFGKS